MKKKHQPFPQHDLIGCCAANSYRSELDSSSLGSIAFVPQLLLFRLSQREPVSQAVWAASLPHTQQHTNRISTQPPCLQQSQEKDIEKEKHITGSESMNLGVFSQRRKKKNCKKKKKNTFFFWFLFLFSWTDELRRQVSRWFCDG